MPNTSFTTNGSVLSKCHYAEAYFALLPSVSHPHFPSNTAYVNPVDLTVLK